MHNFTIISQLNQTMAVIVWQLDLQLPITADVSLNLDQGEVYNIM